MWDKQRRKLLFVSQHGVYMQRARVFVFREKTHKACEPTGQTHDWAHRVLLFGDEHVLALHEAHALETRSHNASEPGGGDVRVC